MLYVNNIKDFIEGESDFEKSIRIDSYIRQLQRAKQLDTLFVKDEQEIEIEIKYNQEYVIIYNSENNFNRTIIANILNFNINQLVLKNEKGLYVIQLKNVIEMYPTE